MRVIRIIISISIADIQDAFLEQDSEILPELINSEGWERLYAEEGNPYYHNYESGETAWEPPETRL